MPRTEAIALYPIFPLTVPFEVALLLSSRFESLLDSTPSRKLAFEDFPPQAKLDRIPTK